jgi:hypothetical protein
MKCFLQYACEVRAISPEDAEILLNRCISALREIANEASREDKQMRPSEQWKRLLVSALSSQHAHLVDANGDNPGPGYGWKKTVRSYANSSGETVADENYQPCGPQIGWIDGEDIYLYPVACYAAVVAEGARSGDNVTTTKETLSKFLAKDKIFATTDKGGERHAIRRRFQGKQLSVYHIKKEKIFPDNTTPSTAPYSPYSLYSIGSEAASEAASEVSTVLSTEAVEYSSELYSQDLHTAQNPNGHSSQESASIGQVEKPPLSPEEFYASDEFTWKDEKCVSCGCGAYRSLGNELVCIRCYPPKGYYAFSSYVDEMFPRMQKVKAEFGKEVQ